MKKGLLSFFAVALAMGFSSFTVKMTTFYLFEAPSTTNQELIQTPEAWLFVGQVPPGCSTSEPYEVCELMVDASDTFVDTEDGNKIKIDPLVAITAASNGSGGYKVIRYDELDGSEPAEIHNMSEP